MSEERESGDDREIREVEKTKNTASAVILYTWFFPLVLLFQKGCPAIHLLMNASAGSG